MGLTQLPRGRHRGRVSCCLPSRATACGTGIVRTRRTAPLGNLRRTDHAAQL